MADSKPTWDEQKTKCVNEVRAVLDRFDAVLDVYAVLRENRTSLFVDVVPKTHEPTPTPPQDSPVMDTAPTDTAQ